MVQQFLRACSFIVADMSGNGIELTPPGQNVLRVRFTVSYQAFTPSPFHARIYNLSPATIQNILNLANEPFKKTDVLPAFQTSAQVTFKAGYGDISQIPILFKGQIYQMRVGRERNVDSYLDVFAQDGDFAHTYDAMNTTFAKGYNNVDVFNALGKSLGKWGVSAGDAPDGLSTTPSIRGKVIYGKTTDHITDLANNNNFTWAIQGMQLQALPRYAFNPGSLVVINSQSGMIGVPEQTEEGISATVLLNPAIRWGTQVHIDQNDIAHLTNKDLGLVTSTATGQKTGIPELNADGRYVVVSSEHVGDTRSNDWFTKFVCITVDPTALPPKSLQTPLPPPVI